MRLAVCRHYLPTVKGACRLNDGRRVPTDCGGCAAHDPDWLTEYADTPADAQRKRLWDAEHGYRDDDITGG
jgi:hypothetical protein